MRVTFRLTLPRVPLILASLALGSVPPAVGQDVLLADRAPRFLAASAARGEPVEVDVSAAPVLTRRVSLRPDATTVGTALQSITRQTGIRFAYSADVLPLDRPLTLQAENITVAGALLEILIDAGVDVMLTTGNRLALVKRAGARASVATGAIAGRVTDAKTGTGLVGAAVAIDGTRHGATTGSDGRYRIAEVAPGTYAVRARYIGYTPGSASVTVSADQEATADFALERSAQQLNEVVTTGTVVPTEVKALPTPISVVTSADIEQRQPSSVTTIFRQAVPSAVAWDNSTFPAQTIMSTRGASTLIPGNAGMKVYIDGIEVADQTTAAIDPSSIDHIEVIRGPQAATIYGSEAIGGVMQVFTKRGDPGLNRPRIQTQAALGAVQTPYAGYGGVLRQNYTASINGGSSVATYNLGVGYTRTGDWVPEAATSLPSAYGALSITQGPVTIDVSGRHYIQNSPGNAYNPNIGSTGFILFSKPFYDPVKSREESYGARVTFRPISWWSNTLTVGVDRNDVDQASSQPRLLTPSDTLLLVYQGNESKTSIGFNTSAQSRLSEVVTGNIVAGVDHYSRSAGAYEASASSTTTGTVGPVDFASRAIVTNAGYFVQGQLGIWDAVFLTGGVRAEQNSTFGSDLGTPLSPRAGISLVQHAGATTVKLRGSYGQAIRPPTPGQSGASVSSSSSSPTRTSRRSARRAGTPASI